MSLCFSSKLRNGYCFVFSHNLGPGVGPISLIPAHRRQRQADLLSSRRARAS